MDISKSAATPIIPFFENRETIALFARSFAPGADQNPDFKNPILAEIPFQTLGL